MSIKSKYFTLVKNKHMNECFAESSWDFEVFPGISNSIVNTQQRARHESSLLVTLLSTSKTSLMA